MVNRSWIAEIIDKEAKNSIMWLNYPLRSNQRAKLRGKQPVLNVFAPTAHIS